MSTVMLNDDVPQDSSPAPHHRRSREEVEALAKTFVATPVEDAAPPKSRAMLLAVSAGAVALAGIVAVFAWPSPEQAARPAVDTPRAVSEVEELRQRLEAERERQRQELQAGTDYMAKMAAADARLVKDLSDQADKLADRQALAAATPAPKPAATRGTTNEALPTPRDEPVRQVAAAARPNPTAAAAPATAAPGAQPKAAATAPQQKVATATQPVQATPAAAEPAQVAQADPSECTIHVSELSSSGKLTYEDIKRMKGARIDADTGHVFTPPVKAAGGRTVVFEVMPDGCVRVGRR